MFTRTELGLAIGATVWAAVSLAGEGTALAFAPLLGAPLLLHLRRPRVAAIAVAAAAFGLFASGVSEENPASLAAVLAATYSLGRHAGGASGYAPVLVLALALTALGPTAPVDVIFVLFVLTGTWVAGRIVRRRAERARHAEDVAAELAARDPEALADQVVAVERGRLAGEAVAVVRHAVEAMQGHAAAAEPRLDPVALTAVQDEGRAAVAELRRLLGLLRAEEPVEDDPGAPVAVSRRGDSGRSALVEAALAAGLAALAVVDVTLGEPGASAGAVALTFAFAAAAVLGRIDPVAGCVAGALPALAALALDTAPVWGFSVGPALALLAWSAAADGRAVALAALAFTSVATLLAVTADAPGNEAIVLGGLVLAGSAGRAWSQRERARSAATATAVELRAEHEAVAAQAVQAERLRIARELHDVVSHAVGAMVLQAGAALAQRERDPEAARAAVRAVQSAGSEAIGELSVLFGLIEAGTVGPAPVGTGGLPERDVAAALVALAERMRGGGLTVDMWLPAALPEDPVALAAAYRVVQEALTNAARHAPGSRVEVALGVAAGCLEVNVADDGGAVRPAPAPRGGGFGLVGLDERVRGLGGELSAGPRAGGGFALSARLPVRERVPA